MWRKALAGLALVMFVTATAAGQMQDDYLAVFVAKVKPDRRAEFDAIVKKMADANRRNKGAGWVAAETSYGESNTVYFTSGHPNYADIEKSDEKFMDALNKAYGQAGATKLLQDFNNTVISSRGEVRARRWGLSPNAPGDLAGINKHVGQSRLVRTMIVRVRPGRGADYVEQLRAIKTAAERATPRVTQFVSQAVAGQVGTVYYISRLESSLGRFDTAGPALPQMLGGEGYQKYLKTVAESVINTETIINRFLPELSNAPEEIAAAAPDFWNPKPAPAKPKTSSEGAKPEANRKQ